MGDSELPDVCLLGRDSVCVWLRDKTHHDEPIFHSPPIIPHRHDWRRQDYRQAQARKAESPSSISFMRASVDPHHDKYNVEGRRDVEDFEEEVPYPEKEEVLGGFAAVREGMGPEEIRIAGEEDDGVEDLRY